MGSPMFSHRPVPRFAPFMCAPRCLHSQGDHILFRTRHLTTCHYLPGSGILQSVLLIFKHTPAQCVLNHYSLRFCQCICYLTLIGWAEAASRTLGNFEADPLCLFSKRCQSDTSSASDGSTYPFSCCYYVLAVRPLLWKGICLP